MGEDDAGHPADAQQGGGEAAGPDAADTSRSASGLPDAQGQSRGAEPTAWGQPGQPGFEGAPEYLSGETAEISREDAERQDYDTDELAAARSDWSDFRSPRAEAPKLKSTLSTGEIVVPQLSDAAAAPGGRPARDGSSTGGSAVPARGFDGGSAVGLDGTEAAVSGSSGSDSAVAGPAVSGLTGAEEPEGAVGSAPQEQSEDGAPAPGGLSAEQSDSTDASEEAEPERAPETAAVPTPTLTQRDWHRRIRELEHRLLGAERTLTYRGMAREMGVSTHSARKLWRALGFPNLEDDVKAFTHTDVEALARMVELVREGYLNEETAISLTRSVGQMTDRMVVWQIEALVEDKIANEQLSDAVARSQVVETLPELIEPIQGLMGYAWRRQLSAALQRLTVRVESGLAASSRGRTGDEHDTPLPLARAVGFADLVSYTSLSRQMSERTLAQMVQRFESKCAEIISIGGGRLVKTVGDEVLYNAETPEAGAEIALALAETIAADDVLPQARVSVVWGRVLSRMGDIYGPTVNLAARLTALADPGTILVDAVTATSLEPDADYLLVPQPPRLVRGFGEVQPHMLLRANGTGIVLDSY